ncbi:MAG TPA: 3-hydroxyacyl-CoA dehydrogenase NAD-binding domain-containing protein [Gemmatimonadaceae bacterium]|nr:3-hydroxyacyl-CoA dehydrogenase NAD-binding domain-containing protein [Gemmatimonadaceae bacterium]
MGGSAQGGAIGVVGAGAMGSGIAQVAALHGHAVILADAEPQAIARARNGHDRALTREVEKGRLTRDEAGAAGSRIRYVEGADAASLQALAPCEIVIEAVVEDLGVKQALFRSLEAIVQPDTVLASNTSSLSIAAIASACERTARVIGIHFFNPAPVMPLVEIVPAITTDPHLTSAVRATVDRWGKTTVIAADTPGFIVNRIARPFYGEALRIHEEGIADFATIDWAMRELGGFRMGPFELMDFIGLDVNFAVSSSVFAAMFYDPRYRPALLQQRLVEAGLLGRKSGRGFYDYRDGAAKPEPTTDETVGGAIVDRILAMLVNEAAEAVHLRVATPQDIELAMTKGVNYPRGLLAWGDAIGADEILARLIALHEEYGEDRYRPSAHLRRVARGGGRLLA